MKKKILFGIGAVALALFVNFNINLFNSGINTNLNLSDIVGISDAQAETGQAGCHGSDCSAGYDIGTAGCCAAKGAYTGKKQ